jgi:hypothetical protein
MAGGDAVAASSYRPYRGRRPHPRRGLIFVIIGVAVLLCVALYFALQEFIVFDAEGFRFAFPFSATEPTTGPPVDEPPPTVVIEGTTTEPATEATHPPTTAPPVRGLTRATLDTAWDGVTPVTQGTAVMIKDVDGVWRVPLPEVSGEGTAAQLAAAEALRGSGAAGVISVFRDHENAAAYRDHAVKVASGKTWLDAGYNRWLSPYARSDDPGNPDGTTLAALLIEQCGALGLGEAVLTSFQFPTDGQVGLIDWGADAGADKIAALTADAERLRQAADAAGIALTCVISEGTAATYVNAETGQSVTELAAYFDAFYVETGDPDYDINPLLEVIQGTGCRVGLWLKGESLPAREIDVILAP